MDRLLSEKDSSGMFSRPGRITSNQYSILRHGEEILTGRPLYHRASSLPSLVKHYHNWSLYHDLGRQQGPEEEEPKAFGSNQ